MQIESTTALQLRASIASVRLQPAPFNSPEAIAQRLTALRDSQISELTTVIAADSEHLPDFVVWRDAFCYECEGSECALGTARELAVKVLDLGWVVESLRGFRLNCLNCQEVSQ